MSQQGISLSDLQSQLRSVGEGSSKKVEANEGLPSVDPHRLAHIVAKVVIPGLPINVGTKPPEGGIFAGLESQGLAGKNIMPGILPDAQGGPLARELSAIFLKNLTTGIGGGETVYSQEGGFTPTPIEAPYTGNSGGRGGPGDD